MNSFKQKRKHILIFTRNTNTTRRRCGVSVILPLCARTSELICMKFSGKVGNWPSNRWLNSGGDLDHRFDTGILLQIRHYWEIRKVVNGHSYWFASTDVGTDKIIKCALAEVCTVSVPLVWFVMAPYEIGQAIIFSSCGFFFLSSISFPRRRRLDVNHTSTHGCGLSANLECRSETCCTRLAGNTGRKNSPKTRQKFAVCVPSHKFVGLYLRN